MSVSGPVCPTPYGRYPEIVMAHGGGGRLMRDLIESIFLTNFGPCGDAHDSARIAVPSGRGAFTTDAYVVNPLFFPGSDIGRLAVFGTANDLLMAGARPAYLSAAFVLEEGLQVETLARVVAGMVEAARESQVAIVTGDTKVVQRGRCDGLYITTAGVGVIEHDLVVAPASICEGDAVLLSGDIGRHGIAVMAAREGIGLGSEIESDCASLRGPVLGLLEAGLTVHCLRDLTRGGLTSALVEIAETAGVAIDVDEEAIPVRDDVRAACELLGFDPLSVANEGRFVAFVPSQQADEALSVLRRFSVSAGASRIGEVRSGLSEVTIETLGGRRPLHMLSGEQLPRIC